MSGFVADVFTPIITGILGAVAGSSVTYFFTRRQQMAGRTPHLIFEFADLAAHENLGSVGFRNISSKHELLIAGSLRNVGTALATSIKLDIYHFRSSTAPPVHEIVGIRVADALSMGESLTWSRSIGLPDITVNGPEYRPGTGPSYLSGPTGVFSDEGGRTHFHHHVVFSCKNPIGEEFSTVYGTEKVFVNKTWTSNRLALLGHFAEYDPKVLFPKEWRNEIADKEAAAKSFVLPQNGISASGYE